MNMYNDINIFIILIPPKSKFRRMVHLSNSSVCVFGISETSFVANNEIFSTPFLTSELINEIKTVTQRNNHRSLMWLELTPE